MPECTFGFYVKEKCWQYEVGCKYDVYRYFSLDDLIKIIKQNTNYYYSNRFKMQFYPSLSSFKQRPSEPIRYLIARNIDPLVKLCITQITEFQNSSQTKAKALDQLKYALLIGEDKITKHTQSLLKSLVRVWLNAEEVPDSRRRVWQVVEVIGYFVSSGYYLPLVINILSQEQYKNSSKSTIALLNILGHMLLRSQALQEHLGIITTALSGYETPFAENDEGLTALFDIAHTLLRRLPQVSGDFQHIAFQCFVSIQATRTIPEPKRKQAAEALSLLSQKAGFASIADLNAAEIGPILERMIKTKEYTTWTRTSKNRFKFDTIIRNCSSQASRFLQEVLQVFECMVSPQSDLQVRMDTLVLIQHLLAIPDLRPALAPLAEQLLKKVLLVAIQWKVGKPQIKIRKAGVINIIALIERSIIGEQQLLDSFKDLIPHLKSCLSDDWAPELRLASCQLLERYLLATSQRIGDDELKELYPMLLERLDDSQDPIRLKITAAINVFFSCRYIKLSESTFDYMISAIFVHFDDNNEDIRSAIYGSLKHAAVVDPKLVLKQAQNNLQRMKHQENCSDLVDYCKERIEQFNS